MEKRNVWWTNKDGSMWFGDGEDSSKEYKLSTAQEITARESTQSAEQLVMAWKENRQKLVDAIEVTYNGATYQGDEKSQERINRAITGISAMPVGHTIEWTAKDNTLHLLSKDDFLAILIDAGQQQSAIWNIGRP